MSAAAFVLGLGLGGAAAALVMANRATSKQVALPQPQPPLQPNSKPELGPSPGQPRGPITNALWTPQTPASVQALLRTACECVDAAPHLEDDDLERCVWAAHWPKTDYPTQSVEGDHPSVNEAFEAVGSAVVAARAGQCQQLPAVDPVPDYGSLPPPPKLKTAEAEVPRPPILTAEVPPPPILSAKLSKVALVGLTKTAVPIDVAALTRAEPTPGYFYQVGPNERFLPDHGLVARALTEAVRIAATTRGWSTQKIQSHTAALVADLKARITYLNLIQCGPWNDALYATWGYGASELPGGHGRAIRLIARHDHVAARLADGQAPIRTLDRGSPADKGSGSATGAGTSFELLWLPPIRVDALLDPSRAQQVVVEGLVWADGSSKYDPPPAVQALGIANAPAGPWGCKGLSA